MGNDAERYRRYLDGDDLALAELIEEHHKGLTLFLNSIVGNIFAAEELMQETFVRLAVKKPRFRGSTYFKTWLYAIGKHAALDYLRKNARSSFAPIDEKLPGADDAEREYLAEESRARLYRAMKKLKPEYAQALYLMYFESFDTAGIAGITGKTKKQVADCLYRAKKALKAELEKENFYDEDK